MRLVPPPVAIVRLRPRSYASFMYFDVFSRAIYKVRQCPCDFERGQTHHEPNVAGSPLNGASDGRLGIGWRSQSGTPGAAMYGCGGAV